MVQRLQVEIPDDAHDGGVDVVDASSLLFADDVLRLFKAQVFTICSLTRICTALRFRIFQRSAAVVTSSSSR